MISNDLLAILVCPETKQSLSLVDSSAIEKFNTQISAGTLMTRDGAKVSEPLHGGLLREDGKILYGIRDDIPVLLIGEGILVG